MSLVLAASAFVLGLLHALDADHVVAVTTFVGRRPDPRRGAWLGVRWALGHALPLLTLGGVAAGLGIVLPARLEPLADLVVGGVLVLLGVQVLAEFTRRRIHLHFHRHDGRWHAHLHSHAASADHDHTHTPTLVGVVHGLSGTAPALALVPAASAGSLGLALSYLGVFSLAVLLAMAILGCGLGGAGRLLGLRSASVYACARGGSGILAVGVGLFLILSR